MKRFVSNILLVSMVLLTQGCLSKSGPLWLVADNIDLKEYREEQIHVLPVVVSDAANFSRSEARKLQRLVADSLKLSLRLREISTPKQLSLPLTYPVDRGQVEALFDKSPDISAVVVVSVYERSLGSDFSDASLGLRLSLFDSEDPEKRLVISRRYISGNGRLDADSTRLSFALQTDLNVVERELKSSNFFGSSKVSEKPTISFAAAIEAKSGEEGAPLDPMDTGTIETTASVYPLRFMTDDLSGLGMIRVSNKTVGFNHDIQKSLCHGDADIVFTDELVEVPLEDGANQLTVLVSDCENQRSVKKLTVTRTVERSVYALGIAIARYRTFDYFDLDEGFMLSRVSRKNAVPVGELFMLRDEEATVDQIREALYEIGSRSYYNKEGVALVYFTGHVVTGKSDLYLAAHDSVPHRMRITGASLNEILDVLPEPERRVLLFDLCVPAQQRASVKQFLPPDAIVSYTSCEESRVWKRLVRSRQQVADLQEAAALSRQSWTKKDEIAKD